jgi:TetR/AcrR family transcriptional repressor of nem operon
MPYSPTHKEKTRARIVECARILFNRHGFEGVTIDMVMEHAELTRGGFYNHFKNKEELFASAVSSFLMGRGARWRAAAGIDPTNPTREDAANMLSSYLSTKHLGDVDGQCPMIALPSDVGRGNHEVQASYQRLLEAMVGLFERSLEGRKPARRQTALTLAALCVGGMVLAKALPDSELANAVRKAAHGHGRSMLGS